LIESSPEHETADYFTDKQKLKSFVIWEEKLLYSALKHLEESGSPIVLNKTAHFYFACQPDADKLLELAERPSSDYA